MSAAAILQALADIQQKVDDIDVNLPLYDNSAEIEELKDMLEERLARIEASLDALSKRG